MGDLMAGRVVLVAGARNKWSLAWHTAAALRREGAQVAFSVQDDRAAGSLQKLLQEHAMEAPVFVCDALQEEQVDTLFARVGAAYDGRLHGLLHAIAYADRNDLQGEFAATSRAGFTLALETSAYTLTALARGARPLMQQAGEGSVVTLSYLGAERAVPNYNVMGVAKAALESSVRYLAVDMGRDNIRVNAVSAGPVKTTSAAGIPGVDRMLKDSEERAPLGRRTRGEEVGDAALFLLSPWARGITGETLYVDCGYHITA